MKYLVEQRQQSRVNFQKISSAYERRLPIDFPTILKLNSRRYMFRIIQTFTMNPFVCPLCGKSYTTKSSLNYHTKTNHNGFPAKHKKKYPCPYPECLKGYNKEARFWVHLRVAHSVAVATKPKKNLPQDENLYWCPHQGCPQVYTSKVHLESHMILCHPYLQFENVDWEAVIL